MCVNVVLVSVTIASHQWLMRPGLVGDTWALPDFDWYGTTELSAGPWFMVMRFFLYPVSHRISPKYINSLAAHLAMCLSALADPLRLRGLFLCFCTLKLPKVTSCPFHMHKHLAEQQVSEVGRDLCWHTSPKSHRHVHSDQLCSLCQDWKEASR